ncbi:hypothetical protein FRC20_003959 [Serendipita sp. 405]|nr:hypothetical protein FRC15_005269 [Serendipita sp. 397]KAG8843453.1 hypothetical protein FRC20_003959 [Serendipita sp. 405]
MLPFARIISSGRYIIVEDYGPTLRITLGIDSFFFGVIVIALMALICAWYSCMACYNFWHSTPRDFSREMRTELQLQYRVLSTSQRWKYTYMTLITVCGLTYGVIWSSLIYISYVISPDERYTPWYKTSNLLQHEGYQSIYLWTRTTLETEQQDAILNIIGFAYSIPILGIHLFACFGLGPDVRKCYMEWIKIFGALVIAIGTSLSRPLKGLMRRVGWQKRTPRANPNDFVPFRTEDIMLENLTVPWNLATASTTGRRPSPFLEDPPAHEDPYIPSNPPKQLLPPTTLAMPSAAWIKQPVPASKR